ncbi:PREDICTED: uncharacterized protein LOC106314677 [Brassica oleracea var. oleracea]|uniref:uncharacterized protein LOC106314677 n=1 Tax=Brassica oleracea var. oleracea TaxID=109376 RepID=UPI0006A6B74B|nr:PREDICTED: uncharacterized protein LOC106314677 [Brassica oleracea var. oleracea]
MADTKTFTDTKSLGRREGVPGAVVCQMLRSTNYTVWAMRMKVLLRVHKVWEAIEPRSSKEDKKYVATALLFQSIPENLTLQVSELGSPKEIWGAIKSRNLGADHVREARLQTLMNEFEYLRMNDSDSIDTFSGKLSELASKAASLGQSIEEAKMVKKFLNSLPRNKYIQIIASLEQVLYLNTTRFKDIVGRLKAYEERIQDHGSHEQQGNRLFSNSENSYDQNGSGNSKGRVRGWNHGRGNKGRGRGRSSSYKRNKEKRDFSQITCFHGKKKCHSASVCHGKKENNQELNKTETEEADIALW